MGLIVWRPDSPVFDDEGLLVEGNHSGQPSQQASQQGDLEEGSTEDDGKIPVLVPIGQGNAENTDEMPRLIQDSRRDPLDQNQYTVLADDSDDEVPNEDVSRPTMPTVQKTRNHVPMLVLRALALDLMTQAINQVLLS